MADEDPSPAPSEAAASSEARPNSTLDEETSAVVVNSTETIRPVDDTTSNTSHNEKVDDSTLEPEGLSSALAAENSNSRHMQPSVEPIHLPHRDLPTGAAHSPHASSSGPSIDVAQNSLLIAPSSSAATPVRAYINVESQDLPIGSTELSRSTTIRSPDSSTTPTPHQRHQDIPPFPHQAYEALQTQYQQPPPPPSPHEAMTRNPNSSPLVKPSGHSDGSLARRDDGRHADRISKPESASSSPGVFTPTSSPLRPEFGSSDALASYSSPYLHYTQRQVPKETHLAEVDVDPISGRKIINHYEIIDELGRGVHGKVKLGRNLESNSFVAIKIIERFSKRRRIGRSGNQENKIKREIAILKKARHPNIVGLLEVIDDPGKKKVYIVLEHVELGEVRWRTKGEEEICLLEYRRCQRESAGVDYSEESQQEDEQILQRGRRRFERAERKWREEAHRRRELDPDSTLWSLEHGGESEIDEPYPDGASHSPFPEMHEPDLTHDTAIHDTAIHDSVGRRNPAHGHATSASQEDGQAAKPTEYAAGASHTLRGEGSRSSESLPEQYHTALEGTMYGRLDSSTPQDKPEGTLADSVSLEEDSKSEHILEHYRYVPLMTLNETRRAIRETLLGLEYLHYQGVIHRDIKPANLLQTIDHHIKISDFGVSYLGKAAKDQAGEDQSESEAQDVDEAVELAKTVGTPAFYAPELCQTDCDDDDFTAAPVTGQIDVWALGVTLYCLVFGRVPFHDHNTFALMRRIAEEDVYIPRFRLKAIEERASSRPSGRSRHSTAMNSDKRFPHEWDYEEVDDDLYDLLYRLLTKDPSRRMKLSEMKRHPWLLSDIGDPLRWINETDPSRIFHGKRIEVSKEDVDVAVVPLNLVEHIRSYARKITGAFGIGKNVSRKRAKSSAAAVDTQPSSAASSSSSISHDARRQESARRASLKPEEVVFAALKASREVDHPLSHSETASPELRDGTRFFIGPSSRPDSPVTPVDGNRMQGDMGSDRLRVLDRTTSTASGTGSVRTIRQSDVTSWAHSGACQPSTLASTSQQPLDMTSGAANLTGIFGGAKHGALPNVRRRERNRVRDGSQFLESRSADEDAHSEPSVAVSRAMAAGEVNHPLALPDGSITGSSAAASPMSSRTPSVTASEMLKASSDIAIAEDGLSRQSSRSSMASRNRQGLDRSWNPAVLTTYNAALGEAKRNDGAEDKLAKAKEEQIRRLIQEGQAQHQARETSSFLPLLGASACPPSPDDVIFQRRHVSGSSFDDSNIGCSARPIVTSSSEDQFNSGMSQSISNPSIPSVASANSSVLEGGTRSTEELNEKEPTVHSAKTITPAYSNHEDSDGYDADIQVEDAVEDSDEDSDDDFIEMTSRKPNGSGFGLSNHGQLSPQRIRRPTGTSVKAARSGSNNTMLRVASNGDSDGDDDDVDR